MKAGIIGASGYTGYELIKILSKHKKVELVALNSASNKGKKVKELYPDFTDDLEFTDITLDKMNKLDVVFLAVPHTKAMEIVPKLKCKVIDLSADYRFKDHKEYEKAYHVKHIDKGTKAAYGLPELFKEEISKASIVANPGCYATAMLLTAIPIKAKHIIFDCKSGWSGAGKTSTYAKDDELLKDNIKAYSLSKHRHKYEVEQFIKSKISFTPHVISAFRGMMITAHILQCSKTSEAEIKKHYEEYYKDAGSVEIVDHIPDIKEVKGSNKVKIGGFEIDDNGQLIIVSVLDNLIKGASGQAVQNMNIMFGIEETEGLK